MSRKKNQKPIPVFTARTHDTGMTNFGIDAEGTVYLIYMRGNYVPGHEHAPTESIRRMTNQNGRSADYWRRRLNPNIVDTP